MLGAQYPRWLVKSRALDSGTVPVSKTKIKSDYRRYLSLTSALHMQCTFAHAYLHTHKHKPTWTWTHSTHTDSQTHSPPTAGRAKMTNEKNSPRNWIFKKHCTGGTFWEAASPETVSVCCGRAEESEPDKTDSSKIRWEEEFQKFMMVMLTEKWGETDRKSMHRKLRGTQFLLCSTPMGKGTKNPPKWKHMRPLKAKETLVERDWQSYPPDK